MSSHDRYDSDGNGYLNGAEMDRWQLDNGGYPDQFENASYDDEYDNDYASHTSFKKNDTSSDEYDFVDENDGVGDEDDDVDFEDEEDDSYDFDDDFEDDDVDCVKPHRSRVSSKRSNSRRAEWKSEAESVAAIIAKGAKRYEAYAKDTSHAACMADKQCTDCAYWRCIATANEVSRAVGCKIYPIIQYEYGGSLPDATPAKDGKTCDHFSEGIGRELTCEFCDHWHQDVKYPNKLQCCSLFFELSEEYKKRQTDCFFKYGDSIPMLKLDWESKDKEICTRFELRKDYKMVISRQERAEAEAAKAEEEARKQQEEAARAKAEAEAQVKLEKEKEEAAKLTEEEEEKQFYKEYRKKSAVFAGVVTLVVIWLAGGFDLLVSLNFKYPRYYLNDVLLFFGLSLATFAVMFALIYLPTRLSKKVNAFVDKIFKHDDEKFKEYMEKKSKK